MGVSDQNPGLQESKAFNLNYVKIQSCFFHSTIANNSSWQEAFFHWGNFTAWNYPFLSFRQLFLILPNVAEWCPITPTGPEHTPAGLSTHIALTAPWSVCVGTTQEEEGAYWMASAERSSWPGMRESPVLSSLSMRVYIFFSPPWASVSSTI